VSLSDSVLKSLLEEKYEQYARSSFITDDPVQLPRRFEDSADQEIIGFLVATIAWGNRITIIRNGEGIIKLFEDEPHAFVMNAGQKELQHLVPFVHRTFNGMDLRTFVLALRNLYQRFGSLEESFFSGEALDMGATISRFKERFFAIDHQARTTKHVADPLKGSSAKRINMFLRWMVRPNDREVDLGIWSTDHLSRLHVPLDVHTGNVSRKLGLLTRKQNDWKAVVELTERLREIDPKDPVRFDIPLFALGVYEPDLINGPQA
jgi:uncharacterized protein (TIGR02757 family)